MDGDRCGVQPEVRVVGVCLIHAAGILARNKLIRRADVLGTIINGPVIKHVLVGSAVRSRAGSGATRRLDSLRSGAYRDALEASAVARHRIVDGNVVLLPHGEHGVVRSVLVRGDLRGDVRKRSLAVELAVRGVVVDEQVIGGQALRPVAGRSLPRCGRFLSASCSNPRPAEERVARARRGLMDVNANVDYGVLISVVRSRAVVLEPADVSGRRRL